MYFPKTGHYTEQVFKIVKERWSVGDVEKIIVATTSGSTALKAVNFFPVDDLVIVTHQAGFKDPGELEISYEALEELHNKGVSVVTATHALAGIDRAIRKKHGTWETSEIIADALRIFGQGTKVCVEIVLMAADAGAIKIRDVIAVGGTGKGADTAWLIKAAHSHTFFDLRMKELLCKPKET